MKHTPAITGRVLGYRAVQVLEYVRVCINEEGVAPSYNMICNELGISSRSKVSKIIASLEKRGLLSRVGTGRVRSQRLPGKACCVHGCERPVAKRGYCDAHYYRWRQHGDPMPEKPIGECYVGHKLSIAN